MRQLTVNKIPIFLAALGDTPETTAAHFMVRHYPEKAIVYLLGDADAFDTAIVQWNEEPQAFGTDANAMHAILSQMSDWTVINVPLVAADDLAELMGDVRFYGDIYYTLTQPAKSITPTDESVTTRLLTLDDTAMMRRAPFELQRANRLMSIEDALNSTLIAGGVVDAPTKSVSTA